MSSVKPVYPNGVFAWTDRVDQEDIDAAGDINSIAAEVISLESIIGTSPEIETNPPTGLPIDYSTVSARISDAMVNNQLPIGELISNSMIVRNNNLGQLNNYKASYDPYKMFNGVDLTIPANGWFSVSASQLWSGWDDGYSYMSLYLNGKPVDGNLLNWEFPGNQVINGVPGRWQSVGQIVSPFSPANMRPIITSVFWQGLAHKGDRFSVFSENGTSNASQSVSNMTLKAAMLRKISGTFTTG